MLQENIIISLLKDGKTFKLTNEIRIGEIDNGKVFFVLGLFTHLHALHQNPYFSLKVY